MNQRGFTLIELIIVIVILGILAVTAAPRFIDLQGDARSSTLQGVKAALEGGSQLVYARAAIEGSQASDSPVNVEVNGTNVSTIFGYPAAAGANTTLTQWADISVGDDNADWLFTADTPAAVDGVNSFTITPIGTDADTACSVTYTEASANNPFPVIEVTDTGC